MTVNGETKKISMSGEAGERDFNALQTKIQTAFGGKVAVTKDGSNNVKIESSTVGEGSISLKVTKGSAKGFGAAVTGTATAGEDALAAGDFKLTLSVMSADDVKTTLGTIDKAISTVSKQRSSLGAVQNRLEHTIKNLNNAAENTQAAEARIRDTDMAKEMSTFTKNNVLSQAAQAMISQANQIPNQALQLLR